MNVYGAIASFGLLGLTNVSNSFLPPPSSLLAPHLLLSQANQPDLRLLAKVFKRFLESETYQTESDIQINSVAGNTTVQTSVNIKTIAHHPNKFRSEITFANPGKTGTTVNALVISDGIQVWLYRPDLKQYQRMKYSEFERYKDSYWLGFSSLLYSQVTPDVRQYMIQDEAFVTQAVQAVGADLRDLRGVTQTVNNRSLYVYQYNDTKEGFVFSAFVEPTTGAIAQFRVQGKAEGNDITITEQIVRRTANPPIAPNTFKFLPPIGVRQVKFVAIGPL